MFSSVDESKAAGLIDLTVCSGSLITERKYWSQIPVTRGYECIIEDNYIYTVCKMYLDCDKVRTHTLCVSFPRTIMWQLSLSLLVPVDECCSVNVCSQGLISFVFVLLVMDGFTLQIHTTR